MLDQTHKQNKYVDLEATFDLINRRKLHGPLTAEVWTGAVAFANGNYRILLSSLRKASTSLSNHCY